MLEKNKSVHSGEEYVVLYNSVMLYEELVENFKPERCWRGWKRGSNTQVKRSKFVTGLRKTWPANGKGGGWNTHEAAMLFRAWRCLRTDYSK